MLKQLYTVKPPLQWQDVTSENIACWGDSPWDSTIIIRVQIVKIAKKPQQQQLSMKAILIDVKGTGHNFKYESP